jgi:hypothetical protein
VIVGTAVVLALRDRLPGRIVVRWDELEPAATMSLGGVLLLAAIAAIGGCLCYLGIGFAIHRSVRGPFAAHAAGTSVGLGTGMYTIVLVQTADQTSAPSVGMMAGVWVGLAAGWTLARWMRPDPSHSPEPDSAPPATLDVPVDARLAWAGGMKMGWPPRLAGAVLPPVPAVAWLLWVGGANVMVAFFVLVVVTVRLRTTRQHELAVDYSGIGLRGAGSAAPSPIKMAEIRSAGVTTVSALRDFAGWGRQRRADGAEGWITRSGEALVVHRHGKPDFVYTVDRAGEAAAVLNTLVARYHPRDHTLTA